MGVGPRDVGPLWTHAGALNLARLTIAVGLPGAGKTTLLRPLRKKGAVRSPLGQVDDALVAALNEGKDCVSDDTRFCHPRVRRDLEGWIRDRAPGTRVEWVFFEKDVDACLHNLVHDTAFSTRDLEGLRSRARSFFDCVQAYELPSPDEVPSEKIRDVVRARRRWRWKSA